MNSNKKYSNSFNTISPTISPTPFGIPPSSNYHISFPYILPSQRSKVRKRINRNDFRRVNRKADEESFVRRFGKRYGAGTAPDNEGYPQCDNVSNSVTTCYPDSETSIDQSQYSKLIWNPNLPQFTNTGNVDIYLFSADTEQIVQSWKDIPNERGSQPLNPNDDWWSPIDNSWGPYDSKDPSQWDGTTKDWTYYSVIVPAGQELTGGEEHQATFTAVQTAPLTSLVQQSSTSSMSTMSTRSSMSSMSTMSSASFSSELESQSIISSVSALSSSSMASVSSISLSNSDLFSSYSKSSLSTRSVLSTAATETTVTTTNSRGDSITTSYDYTPTGVLQNNGDDDGFPAWAIAVIVVLGALLLAAIAGVMYLLIRQWRRAHGAEAAAAAAAAENGGATTPTQADPLMKDNRPNDGTILAGASAGAGAGAIGAAGAAATNSNEGSSEEDGQQHEGPISSTEAAAMADAFRQALRSPEFDSNGNSNPTTDSSNPNPSQEGVLNVDSNNAGRQPELVHGSDNSH